MTLTSAETLNSKQVYETMYETLKKSLERKHPQDVLSKKNSEIILGKKILDRWAEHYN